MSSLFLTSQLKDAQSDYLNFPEKVASFYRFFLTHSFLNAPVPVRDQLSLASEWHHRQQMQYSVAFVAEVIRHRFLSNNFSSCVGTQRVS